MTASDSSANNSPQGRSNLTVRLITALMLAPLVLACVFAGGWPFTVLAIVLAIVSMLEFYELGRDRGIPGNIVVGLLALVALLVDYTLGAYLWLPLLFVVAGAAAYLLEMLRGTTAQRRGRVAVTLAGLAYAGFPSAFLIAIRAAPDGITWLLFIICVTWGTDTLAYFGGRWWGRRPLAPRISPKKTVEGALVGVAFGFAAGVAMLALAGKFTVATLALALLGPPLAVIGDLFESHVKRFFHAKDSHLSRLNLIPGHGGVLDRTDSLIWVTSLCYLYLLLAGLL